MSTRIDQAFARLKANNEGALVAFLTAGDPSPEHTPELVTLLARSAGADVIELGIPYSDPLADGPSIQASSQRALDRGVTPPRPSCRWCAGHPRTRPTYRMVLMTSYNLVLRYGLGRFAAGRPPSAGADGAILADLPPEEARALETGSVPRARPSHHLFGRADLDARPHPTSSPTARQASSTAFPGRA